MCRLADHPVEVRRLAAEVLRLVPPLLWRCAVSLTVMFRASLLASGSFDFGVDCCWVLVSHEGCSLGGSME